MRVLTNGDSESERNVTVAIKHYKSEHRESNHDDIKTVSVVKLKCRKGVSESDRGQATCENNCSADGCAHRLKQ